MCSTLWSLLVSPAFVRRVQVCELHGGVGFKLRKKWVEADTKVRIYDTKKYTRAHVLCTKSEFSYVITVSLRR